MSRHNKEWKNFPFVAKSNENKERVEGGEGERN
jgi:hypothetical protein